MLQLCLQGQYMYLCSLRLKIKPITSSLHVYTCVGLLTLATFQIPGNPELLTTFIHSTHPYSRLWVARADLGHCPPPTTCMPPAWGEPTPRNHSKAAATVSPHLDFLLDPVLGCFCKVSLIGGYVN